MTDTMTAAQFAVDIREARDRLVVVAELCSDDHWCAHLSNGDTRPVGVIVDHVADAYGYLGDFIGTVLRGEDLVVNADVVDALNERHSASADGVTREQAIENLRRRGDAFIALVTALRDDDLELAGGRIARLASIAVRHADDHRTDIEARLAERN